MHLDPDLRICKNDSLTLQDWDIFPLRVLFSTRRQCTEAVIVLRVSEGLLTVSKGL